VAEGYQGFAVAGALLYGDVPLRGDGRKKAEGLRGIGPSQVREMTEGAAVVQVICRVMGGKRQGLQRESGHDQEQDRKRL
jgi:hypothetical protein